MFSSDKNSAALLASETRHTIWIFSSRKKQEKMSLDSQVPCSGLLCLELVKSNTITSTEVTGNFEPNIPVIYLVSTVRFISWPRLGHEV